MMHSPPADSSHSPGPADSRASGARSAESRPGADIRPSAQVEDALARAAAAVVQSHAHMTRRRAIREAHDAAVERRAAVADIFMRSVESAQAAREEAQSQLQSAVRGYVRELRHAGAGPERVLALVKPLVLGAVAATGGEAVGSDIIAEVVRLTIEAYYERDTSRSAP